jgi:hypothetical protein
MIKINNKGWLSATGQGVPSLTSTGSLRKFEFKTEDAPAVVEATGYFNSAADQMPVGSTIEAVMGLGVGGTVEFKSYVVSANTGTVVTIKLQKTAAG